MPGTALMVQAAESGGRMLLGACSEPELWECASWREAIVCVSAKAVTYHGRRNRALKGDTTS